MARKYDKAERARIGVESGRLLDPEMVGASMTRMLEETIDPMKKVIEEHNKKILEEIAVREQLLVAERSMIDWWIEVNPRLENALGRAGVRSTAGQAAREIKQKQGLLR
jgi:hypothetical protein